MTALYQSHTSHLTASAGSITGEKCVELERNGVTERAGQGERKRRRGKGEKGDERGRKNCLGPGEVAGHSVYISLTTKSTTFEALHELPFFVHRDNSTSLPVNHNQSTTPCFDYSRSCLLLLPPFRLHPLALYSEAKPGLSSCTTMLTSFGSRTHRDQVSPGSWNLSRCGRKNERQALAAIQTRAS